MQTIAIISKSTKQGLSVFHFVKTPDGQLWAFGGCQAKAMHFSSIKELNTAIATWTKSYGYSFGMQPAKPVTTRPAKPVWDKQESQLPLDLQQDLWALEPTTACA